METEIKQYYKNQEVINLIKENIQANRQVFEESMKDDFDKLKMFEEENEKLRSQISAEAKTKYIETGNKKLDYGIGIRVMNKLSYDDEKAIEWAKENMPIAIKQTIDKKQFETYAKTTELDFVDKSDEITITFPKEFKNE